MIENPFQPHDRIVALAAIQPDVALFHARRADRLGNVFIGRERELMTLAHAARATLVTVEEIVEYNLLDDVATASGTIPALYIAGIAHAARGAAPYGFHDQYADDEAVLTRYATQAGTQVGFERFISQWLGESQPQLATV